MNRGHDSTGQGPRSPAIAPIAKTLATLGAIVRGEKMESVIVRIALLLLAGLLSTLVHAAPVELARRLATGMVERGFGKILTVTTSRYRVNCSSKWITWTSIRGAVWFTTNPICSTLSQALR